MNSSIGSTSESRVSSQRNVFKPSVKTVIKPFEVSLSESTSTDVFSNKTDFDVTSSSSKPRPFKSKISDKQVFNVSLSEPISEFEVEKTVVQPKPLFKRSNIPEKFVFNVSYNETNTSEVDRSNNENDSTTIPEKSYAFRKRKGTSNDVSFKKKNMSFSEVSLGNQKGADKSSNEISISLQDDLNTPVTKANPFIKFSKKVDPNKENFKLKESEIVAEKSLSRISSNEIEPTVSFNKSNQFKRKTTSKSKNESRLFKVTYAEDDNEEELMESKTEVLKASERTTENIKNDASLVNKTANSEFYLDQSSFNDDNLNNWMSDHSDDEIPPPDLAPMTGNISALKDREEQTAPTQAENTSLSWEQKFENIVSNFKKPVQQQENKQIEKPAAKKSVQKPVKVNNSYKPPKLIKPARFVTKRLYRYVIDKLKPKYGIDAVVEAEQLILSVCDTVKIVCRRKAHQKSLINSLKKEMAKAGLIETTVDFYEFVIKFLPYEFRCKVVPCVQPVTNTVYPPKDTTNPFDKIL